MTDKAKSIKPIPKPGEYHNIQVTAVKIEPFKQPIPPQQLKPKTPIPKPNLPLPTLKTIPPTPSVKISPPPVMSAKIIDIEESDEIEQIDDINNDDEGNNENDEEMNENEIDEGDIDAGEDDLQVDEEVNEPDPQEDPEDPAITQEQLGNPLLTKTCGVIYLAYGKKYIMEAIKSARSFKKFHRGIPISVYTDHESTAARYPELFARVVGLDPAKRGFKISAYAKLEKIKAMRDSPYEVTLYLDCDTVVLKPIGELFKRVAGYDMMIANSPHLDTSQKPYRLVAFAKPKAYNSGVIMYQKNERMAKLFRGWLSLSSQDKNTLMKVRESFYDQPKLVKLLNSKKSDIKLKVIPNVIYNARHTMIPRLKKQHLYSKVKIIHTHTP